MKNKPNTGDVLNVNSQDGLCDNLKPNENSSIPEKTILFKVEIEFNTNQSAMPNKGGVSTKAPDNIDSCDEGTIQEDVNKEGAGFKVGVGDEKDSCYIIVNNFLDNLSKQKEDIQCQMIQKIKEHYINLIDEILLDPIATKKSIEKIQKKAFKDLSNYIRDNLLCAEEVLDSICNFSNTKERHEFIKKSNLKFRKLCRKRFSKMIDVADCIDAFFQSKK